MRPYVCVHLCLGVSWDIWILFSVRSVYMWIRVCVCVSVFLACVWCCVGGLLMSVPCVPVIRMCVHAYLSVCVFVFVLCFDVLRSFMSMPALSTLCGSRRACMHVAVVCVCAHFGSCLGDPCASIACVCVCV